MSSSSVWNKSDSVKIECTCQGWNKTCQKLTALYVCVGVIALSQIVLYTYLYKHISLMEGPYFPDDFPDSETPESRIRRETSDMDNSVASKAEVEFISPSLRAQIEAERSATNSTDPWVWLTSYSRIPMFAIQEFCAATKEYCPPGLTGPIGPAGLPGLKGDKGNKGDSGERGVKGDPGPRGPVGPPGDVGPRGPRGDQGPPGIGPPTYFTGSPGLDGRDGIPGEPGLDGIPGRNGIDGIPGRAGSSGTDGTPGVPGSNGTDGIPGKTGPIGPPGPMGPKGLPGPKGRPGKPGTNGTPGTPGIQAWGVTVNGTKSSELLIPPAIVGSETIFASGPIVAREGENVRLMCAATGNPRPIVQWRKLDKPTIGLGKWQEYSVLGGTFNITRINREHMGLYMCIASNGIPPSANQSFILEVHFPPLIRIQNQHVGIKNYSTATLQCEVEAYPDAVKYWEAEDGSLIEASDKYIISSTDIGKYRTLMELNITNVNYMDYGTYHCISKNELGLTKGVFKVYEMRPGLVPPHGPDTIAVYGERPPERVDINDLCPAPPACQECPKELRCNQGIYSLYDLTGHRDLEILPLDLNRTYPGLPNRTLDCQVYAVGKPVFLKDSEKLYGSWMRDPLPKSEQEKYWTTSEDNNLVLYEYANKTMYRNSIPTKEYKLKFPFSGNTHVIYNGSFFYHQNKLPEIIKYELSTETSQPLPMPHAFVNESNYLYSSEKNFMDFSVDDNGLWVIYGLPESNNTAVVKVDAYSLEIQYAWNISLKHQRAGEMFIVCGVLYVVDSVMDRKTHIRFALDLYKNLLLEDHQPIEFTNPFRRTTMIGYNHKHKELYTWDKGNQLTYPIRYHEIGYNVSKEEKNEPEANKLQSGYEVF